MTVEQSLIIFALNYFCEGGHKAGHPMASLETLRFFSPQYIDECLGRVSRSQKINDETRLMAHAFINSRVKGEGKMTVKELIEKLQQLDLSRPIMIPYGEEGYADIDPVIETRSVRPMYTERWRGSYGDATGVTGGDQVYVINGKR